MLHQEKAVAISLTTLSPNLNKRGSDVPSADMTTDHNICFWAGCIICVLSFLFTSVPIHQRNTEPPFSDMTKTGDWKRHCVPTSPRSSFIMMASVSQTVRSAGCIKSHSLLLQQYMSRNLSRLIIS